MTSWILAIIVIFNDNIELKELKIYSDYIVCQRAAKIVTQNMKDTPGFQKALCVPGKKLRADVDKPMKERIM